MKWVDAVEQFALAVTSPAPTWPRGIARVYIATLPVSFPLRCVLVVLPAVTLAVAAWMEHLIDYAKETWR